MGSKEVGMYRVDSDGIFESRYDNRCSTEIKGDSEPILTIGDISNSGGDGSVETVDINDK